jgi:hypothetical protein
VGRGLSENVKVSLLEAILDDCGGDLEKANLREICDESPKLFGAAGSKNRSQVQRYFSNFKHYGTFIEECQKYKLLPETTT